MAGRNSLRPPRSATPSPPAAAVRITLPTETVHARVHQMWLLLALVGLAVPAVVAGVGFAIAR
ncbi:hypothetical protein [Streptomyces incanus]|uniref:Uncharacterized protein n=1 Tax=Streptomyces incanus TaxID=887453 RepID=A0ABW0XFK0_9ACTN